jgi:hypothetical protein
MAFDLLKRDLPINAGHAAFFRRERTQAPATGTLGVTGLGTGQPIHVNFLDPPRNPLPDFMGGSFNQKVMRDRAPHNFSLLIIQLDLKFRHALGRFRNFLLELLDSTVHDRSLRKTGFTKPPQPPHLLKKRRLPLLTFFLPQKPNKS